MAFLVMDTATSVLAVALGRQTQALARQMELPGGQAELWGRQTELLGSTVYQIPRGHSRLLQPAISDLLERCGLEPADLEGIGVGVGPGSYTGVRLAVATAKAMAMALKVPLYTVSTLQALAEAALPGRVTSPVLVMPLLYARRQRAYGAIYEKAGNQWTCQKQVAVRPVSEWLTELQAQGSQVPGNAMGQTSIVMHDFTEKTGLLPMLQQAQVGRQVELAATASSLGPALLRIVASGGADRVTGDNIHHVVPHYALQVEAEVKLAQGGIKA